MTDAQQGYGPTTEEPRMFEDEPAPPATEDDWGLDETEVDEAAREASRAARDRRDQA